MQQDAPPRPSRPALNARLAYRIARLVVPNRFYRRVSSFLERRGGLRRIFTAGERVSKQALFGCRMCGQCALPVTGYACPMTCPKQLRNGPCGGVAGDGGCEVYPDRQCVFVTAYERAALTGRTSDLNLLHRPIDRRRQGESSWLNYWQGRDEELWVSTEDASRRPSLLARP